MKRARGDSDLVLRPRARHFLASPEELAVEYLESIVTNDDAARDVTSLLQHRSVTRRIISEATIGSSADIAERKARIMRQQQLLEELGAVEMKDYLEHHFNDLSEQVERAPPLLRSRLHEVHMLPREAAARRIGEIIEEYDRMIAGATDSTSQSTTWALNKNYYTAAATAFQRYASATFDMRPHPSNSVATLCASLDRMIAEWPRTTLVMDLRVHVENMTSYFAQLTRVTLSESQVSGAPPAFYRRIEDDASFETTYVLWAFVAAALMDMMEELRGLSALGPTQPPHAAVARLGCKPPSSGDVAAWIGKVYNPRLEDDATRQYDDDLARLDAYNAAIRPGECDGALARHVAQRNRESNLATTLFAPSFPLSAEIALSVLNTLRPEALATLSVEPRTLRVFLSALVSTGELTVEQAASALKTRCEMRNAGFRLGASGISIVEVNAYSQEYLVVVDDEVFGRMSALDAAGLFMAFTTTGLCRPGGATEIVADVPDPAAYFVEVSGMREITKGGGGGGPPSAALSLWRH